MALGLVVMISKEGTPRSPGKDQGSDQSTSRREALASGIGVTGPPLPLDELLSKSDFLSVHVPLTANTKYMIAQRELALMKPTAVIINAARGGVIDEKGASQVQAWLVPTIIGRMLLHGVWLVGHSLG